MSVGQSTLYHYEETTESDSLNAYILTLVEQRRELHKHIIEQCLASERGDGVAAPFLGSVPVSQIIQQERKTVQHELVRLPPQRVESLQGLAVHAVDNLSAGKLLDAASAHFHRRSAALKAEHSRLLQLLCCDGNQDFQGGDAITGMLAKPSWPSHVEGYLQALLLAQADATARLARFKESRQLHPSDLEAMAVHAAMLGPAERLGHRLQSRLACLPWSHHHRFLVYEQVTKASTTRNNMHGASQQQLPAPVRTRSDSHAAITALLQEFGIGDEQLHALQGREAHLQHAYLANKIFSKVFDGQQQLLAFLNSSKTAAGPCDMQLPTFMTEVPAVTFAEADASHMVELVDVELDRLQGITPSLEGDLSAGHHAVLHKMAATIDETLYAENKFLDEHEANHILPRLVLLAKQHALRYQNMAADDTGDEAMAFSAINLDDHSQQLQTKSMEAFYVLRCLHTRSCKLKVLYVCNACVFLLLQMLRDEDNDRESECTSTKQYTSPFTNPDSSTDAGAIHDSLPSMLDYLFEDHADVGVVVRRAHDKKLVVHRLAIKMFKQLEEEILRAATHYVDASLMRSGDGQEPGGSNLDRMAVLHDLWQAEANFSTAQYKLLHSYQTAYGHASAWGVPEMLDAGRGSMVQPPLQQGPILAPIICCSDACGARTYLRTVLVDTVFRRPNLCLEDAYFLPRYLRETTSLQLEAGLVQRISSMVGEQQQQALQQACAAAQARFGHAPATPEDLWRPGVLPAFMMLPGDTSVQPPLEEVLYPLEAVGTSIGRIHQTLADIVAEFASIHQVKHYVDVSELRLFLLEYAIAELDLLVQEEGFREHSHSFAKAVDGATSAPVNRRGGAHAEFSGNWLLPAIVGDDALLMLGVSQQQNCTPKQLLEAVIMRDELLRGCYEAEVWWLVYQVQSRALGWKLLNSGAKPINWDGIDNDGNAVRSEMISEFLAPCDPDDFLPPNATTPPGSSEPCTPGSMHGPTPGIGRAGVLGGIWRAPFIALNEFSEELACTLDLHSLAKLKALLQPGSVEFMALRSAVKAQRLKVVTKQVAVQHNQVVLDQIIRALIRRQNQVLFRNTTAQAKRMHMEQALQSAPSTSANVSITDWKPTTVQGEVARRSCMRSTATHLVEGGGPRVVAEMREYRKQMVQQLRGHCVELQGFKLKMRTWTRKHFVLQMRAAGQRAEGNALAVKLQVYDEYIKEVHRFLQPYFIKVSMVRAASSLVHMVLGSTGGVTGSWGVLPQRPGESLKQPARMETEASPFFGKGSEAAWLQRILVEYGPLWQAMDPDPLDGAFVPIDLAKYRPRQQPPGFCFLDADGRVPVDQLPVLPSILDIITWQPSNNDSSSNSSTSHANTSSTPATAPAPAPTAAASGATATADGGAGNGSQADQLLITAAGMMQSLLLVCSQHILQESLQVAAAHIAQAGDITRGHQDSLVCDAVLGRTQGSGTSPAVLLQTAASAFQANKSSLLPAAVLAPLFMELRNAFLHLPKAPGGASTAGNLGSKAPAAFLAKSATEYMQRKADLLALQQLVAVARFRASCAAAGAAKKGCWAAAYALEVCLASKMQRSEPMQPQAALLRLGDDCRLGLYNQVLKTGLSLEGAVATRGVNPLTAPTEALHFQEGTCAALWVRDRLQDALLHRAVKMAAPELLQGLPITEAQFTKAYAGHKLHAAFLLPPVVQCWMQDWFQEHVAGKVESLAWELHKEAQAAGSNTGSSASGSAARLHALGEKAPPDTPSEMLLLDAGIRVLKQEIDKQCVLLAISRLKEECRQLAAQCSAVGTAAEGGQGGAGAGLLPTTKGQFGEAASMLLLRRLCGGPRVAPDGPHGFEKLELKKDDVVRWTQDFIRQVTAEGRAATASLLETAAEERHHLQQAVWRMEDQVQLLEAQSALEVQRRAVRVETQVLDRVMDMVASLGAMRRSNTEMQAVAAGALERAYEQVHDKFAGRVEELERELEVARLNLKETRAQMHQSALDALGDIKSEMLHKVFGASLGGRGEGTGSPRLVLESDQESLLEARAEVVELQRAMAKIQAWFKLRSQAFQTACKAQTASSMKQVQELQAENWEMRQRHEVEEQKLRQHLAAMQRQLEAAMGELQQRSMEVQHLTTSNRRLLRQKIAAQSGGGAQEEEAGARGSTAAGASLRSRPGTATSTRTASRPGTARIACSTFKGGPSTAAALDELGPAGRPRTAGSMPLATTSGESRRPGTAPPCATGRCLG